MSRRRRAAAFGALAVLAAVLAGAIVDGYGSSVANSYGELRQVLVTRAALPRGRRWTRRPSPMRSSSAGFRRASSRPGR